MADESYRRFYGQSAFLALTSGLLAALPLFKTEVGLLALTAPIVDVRLTVLGVQLTVVVEWAARPSDNDLLLVDGKVASFVGSATTSEPIVAVSAGATTAANATLVDKIDLVTPPLDAGTYQVIWTSQLRMQAVVVGDAARAVLTITPSGGAPQTQMDHWGEAVVKAYNGAATFLRAAGQTIRVQLQLAEVGPGVGVAEISLARVTIDKIG